MYKNKELHQFLLEKAWKLTEEWYESLDKSDPFGVYANTDPDAVNVLKNQNYEFHLQFFQLFNQEESAFMEEFEGWIIKVANDGQHLATPSHLILREFFRIRGHYIKFIKEFASIHEGKYSEETIDLWKQKVFDMMDKVIIWFMEEYHKFSMSRLESQQEMIYELSSPVITLNKTTALLPLVGDIDTARAKLILENTLKQCSRKRVDCLLIDLSGVVMIDTMVAQQIFQLIEALDLIGVKTTLSGIRPEIAQTAIQLGLDFDKVSITSTLSNAMDSISTIV
ncbi:STAS domain-containing protein [Domibacillus epiphyticus]|uniref:RsbT co-antagonist protein RsbRB n=1 Tax=Domibacillus epiphyticus TaxID=1714355 RepID=A0A1V2A596_9BACI|nr:STAS domain-containing protein [Domibacillus epiphyticus]OMP66175.1 RsbT co-antagonist protein RsbRB [Domibacillus epiphyticus]